jgi:hypothetical protein
LKTSAGDEESEKDSNDTIADVIEIGIRVIDFVGPSSMAEILRRRLSELGEFTKRKSNPDRTALTRIFHSPSKMCARRAATSQEVAGLAQPLQPVQGSIQTVIVESSWNALELIRFEGAARLPAERI